MSIDEIYAYCVSLRQRLIDAFENIEPKTKFEKTPWEKPDLGSGEIGLLRGDIFEKAAVNISKVSGQQFPMKDSSGPYRALGVSLITHLHNPHMPTAHFNVRYIEQSDRYWFGGGFDLTPMGCDYPEDTAYFHHTAQTRLDAFDPTLYPQFYEEAKRYFFIPHRQKERGVGGIFFDHYQSGDKTRDFELMQVVGSTFLEALLPIYQKRINTPYTHEEKLAQLKRRGHYVEFNLLYDRGTRFGFLSNGNPDAILCSMPPVVHW